MRYSELHCKTNFSFLEGASHPDELVHRAAELEYMALAITDRNSVAGVVRAHIAAKELGMKLIVGAEITPSDAPPVVLLATDRAAYGRLSRLITQGRRSAPKGEFRLTLDDIARYAEGLIACVGSPSEFGTRKSEGSKQNAVDGSQTKKSQKTEAGSQNGNATVRTSHSALCIPPSLRLLDSPPTLNRHALLQYREIFNDRCYLLAELHCGPDDVRELAGLQELSRQSHVPLIAAGDVHYHCAGRKALHDVLTATRLGCTVAEAGPWLLPNAQRHLKSPAEMAARFTHTPDAIRRTCEIAEQCTFSLDDLRYEYPEELAPPGKTPLEHLTELTWNCARDRYPQSIPEKVRKLVRRELQLIGELHYEAYFLTVWDLVRFARSRGILCQGRGSAANSAVCYCLGVTSVDPERLDVLFERFLSRERNEAPDIDIDFEHERREEVLQYVYDKYGRERTGMTAEVITYRPRSAVRDVGKALGLSLDRVDALAKTLDGYSVEPRLADRCRMAGLDVRSQVGRQLLALVGELVGFPRHLSQHVGGMVMTQGPLCELVPIENAAMADRTVIQWDKDDLDELGILKVDCLSLGMLTAIRKCFTLVEDHYGRNCTLTNIPEDDPGVYDMICQADTMGVFQIESRAQMSMLPRLRPRRYYDLVIEVAIVRPGPIQGNMVHPYLRRRSGDEPVTYPSDEIEEVLKRTLGVPLFQEQAMRLAVVAAGFTPGEADQLRRAMGAWRRPGIIDEFHQKLVEGMRERGLSPEFAEHVFNQIRGFGEYGFPESHAASFAMLVYVSAWLKHYYPAAFAAALINSQPMGFYAPAQLIRNAREHGVAVMPIDVNHSQWDCTLEELRIVDCELRSQRTSSSTSAFNPNSEVGSPKSLRLGLRLIRGLSESYVERIEEARRDGPFRSIHEFTLRTGLSRAVVARLAEADAFGSIKLDRRGSLWQALLQDKKSQNQPLLQNLEDDDPPLELPAMTQQQEVFADYQTSGLSLRSHPVSFYRDEMSRLGIVPASALATLPKNKFVRIGGLVLVRQRPSTAKGITFVTLEDETGTANLIIRMDVWERYYQPARTASALVAQGRLQREHGIIHVLVSKLENLSGKLNELKSNSRDFQ